MRINLWGKLRNYNKNKIFTGLILLVLITFGSFIFFGSFNLPVLAQSSKESSQNSQFSISQSQSNTNNSNYSSNLVSVLAQDSTSLNNPASKIEYQFYRIKVLQILEEKKPEISLVGDNAINQKLKAVIVDQNKEIELEYNVINATREQNKIKAGDELIVSQGYNGEKIVYNVVGFYRLPAVIVILLVFFILTVWVCGKKGFLAIIGLIFSILAIGWWLIPAIISGFSPFFACVIIAIFLAIINLYLAHGFNLRTTVALISVLLTLILSAFLAPFMSNLTHLFGVAADEAFYLQAWEGGKLDLQGLFLGGIIIGTLGVLDDVATAQAATVEEIAKANPSLTLWQLYGRGMKVGREHILSMINTLALAYVGVSLPLILSFVIVKAQPWWSIASSDLITEEVVRTLVGSFCLILTVPVCNFLAAFAFTRRLKNDRNKQVPQNNSQVPESQESSNNFDNFQSKEFITNLQNLENKSKNNSKNANFVDELSSNSNQNLTWQETPKQDNQNQELIPKEIINLQNLKNQSRIDFDKFLRK